MEKQKLDRIFNLLQVMPGTMGACFLSPNALETEAALSKGKKSLNLKVLQDIYNPEKGVDFKKGDKIFLDLTKFDSNSGILGRFYGTEVFMTFAYIVIERFVDSLVGALGFINNEPVFEGKELSCYCFFTEEVVFGKGAFVEQWQAQGFPKRFYNLHFSHGSNNRLNLVPEAGVLAETASNFLQSFTDWEKTSLGEHILKSVDHFGLQANERFKMDLNHFRDFKQLFMKATSLGWLEQFKFTKESVPGKGIFMDDLMEIISILWELFLEFSWQKGGMFDWSLEKHRKWPGTYQYLSGFYEKIPDAKTFSFNEEVIEFIEPWFRKANANNDFGFSFKPCVELLKPSARDFPSPRLLFVNSSEVKEIISENYKVFSDDKGEAVFWLPFEFTLFVLEKIGAIALQNVPSDETLAGLKT